MYNEEGGSQARRRGFSLVPSSCLSAARGIASGCMPYLAQQPSERFCRGGQSSVPVPRADSNRLSTSTREQNASSPPASAPAGSQGAPLPAALSALEVS